MDSFNLELPIDSLPFTSSVTKRRLKAIGLNTYWDLLNYFPYRYENYSLISQIGRLQIGEIVTIKGKIIKINNAYTKKGFNLQKIVLADDTGKIEVNWFNQSYLLRMMRIGMFLSIAGEVKFFGKTKTFEPREYEIIKDVDIDYLSIHTGRIIPVYSEKNGLSAKLLREKISYLLNQLNFGHGVDGIKEFLPAEIISFNKLFPLAAAYKNIHFPDNPESAKKSRDRLGFDELFIIQLSAQIVRREWEKEHVGNIFDFNDNVEFAIQKFISGLPFALTFAQKRVVNEILSDLKKPKPMNRFLEGDVGSGKTVVAAIASYAAYLNGYQSLFMAPTEILAEQHFQTFSQLFPKKTSVNSLLTRTHKLSKADLSKSQIIIGTHSLLGQKLNFSKVGLVIIDEQHRFGVVQRSELKQKGINPHLLTMTATPIPRTIALTLFGELDLSLIDEMPQGRLPIKSFLVPAEKRQAGYRWIKEQIQQNDIQVFIICPLIEESEVETMKSVKAAAKEFARLKRDIFPEFNLGLLHGKVKAKEKEKIMQDFKALRIDILVATSVVEVGIDFPNATIMMIEGAERFGMAQLHQLRGRIGRGDKQSYCFLYTESRDETVVNRLNLFTKTNSGMQVAEYDLKLRGPGEIFGTRQHGYLDLKIASLSDFVLIKKTKNAVNYFLMNCTVNKYPDLKNRLADYKTKQINRD